MSFAALPPELLNAIFEPLSKPTLAALATTCSSFTACADRHLYRHLSLSSHARNLAAVHSLAARPLLASYVRTLEVDAEDDDVQGLCSALQQALETLGALTSLELNVGTSDGWLLQGGAGGTFPDLHHFATSLAFDSNLVAFLLRTPALVSLSLSSPVSPMDVSALVLPTQAVPKLTQYTGPASLLRHLSPRPLTTLLLSDDLTLEDVQYLQGGPRAPSLSANTSLTTVDGSTVPPTAVQVLSAITSAPPALMIEALAKACPDLTCLRVMTTCAFWEAPDLVSHNSVPLSQR